MDFNQFIGSVPENIGWGKNLLSGLGNNYLGLGRADDLKFITSLTNCSNLNTLWIGRNLFGGILPNSIASLSIHLSWLAIGENQFVGNIPSEIGNLINLQNLDIYETFITGTIPASIGMLKNLQQLVLENNKLYGEIPSTIEVGNLKHLDILDVPWNKLSGEIPSSLANCKSVRGVLIQGNSFRGDVLYIFTTLTAIEGLDLSYNNFSGIIPKYLEGFQFLRYLNLSFNNFEGEVPKQGVFGNVSAISVVGNDNLCGGIPELKLPTCPILANDGQGKAHVSRGIILVISAAVCLIFLLCALASLYWLRKSSKKPSSLSSMEGRHLKLSYAELFKATNGFSSDNLIGIGSYGSVYKGILGRIENTVAVKVLNLDLRGASQSFTAECNALRNIRHRNLVKILTSCSSMNFGENPPTSNLKSETSNLNESPLNGLDWKTFFLFSCD
ncbi:putative receptor-like protein kinase At3g47110 [Tasmannia lanceolata]|uniref:putative receptor-like protein kinase At3g47110 n=1 Tax=Tasmannia lanceolata TaxID=3420 RepID=UPI0040631034